MRPIQWFALVPALACIVPSGSGQAATAGSTTQPVIRTKVRLKQPSVVHLVVINLSGAPREIRIRGEVVPLPVAERIALKVRVGDPLLVASNSDRKVARTILIQARDEGRTIPID